MQVQTESVSGIPLPPQPNNTFIMKLLNGSTLANLTAICAELKGGHAFKGAQRFAGSCTISLPVSHGCSAVIMK